MQAQEVYARWLDRGTKIAFAVCLATLLIYLSGALPPYVALQDLTELWTLPLAQYLERTGAPTGWGWLAFLGFGDYLNFIGIGLFALITLACYLRVIPLLLAEEERLHLALASAQALVLVAAASGLFAGSG